MRPLLTTVIPAYNCEAFLRRAVESALDQGLSAEEQEIILVDDKSTDNTAQLCQQLAKELECVRFVGLDKNGGAGAARNAGIAHASGEYIHFVDADDLLIPGAFSKLVAKAKQENLDVLFFSSDIQYETPELEKTSFQDPNYFSRSKSTSVMDGKDLFAQMMADEDFCGGPTVQLTKVDTIRDRGIRFAEGIVNEDNQYVLGSLMYSSRCAMVTDSAYVYIVRKGSVTTNQSKGLKRMIAHLYLSEYVHYLQMDPSVQGKEEVLKALRQIDIYFLDCAREAFWAIPYAELPRTIDATVNVCALYEAMILPLRDAEERERAEAELAKARLELERQKVSDLTNSSSMKAGKAITALPRLAKKVIKK